MMSIKDLEKQMQEFGMQIGEILDGMDCQIEEILNKQVKIERLEDEIVDLKKKISIIETKLGKIDVSRKK